MAGSGGEEEGGVHVAVAGFDVRPGLEQQSHYLDVGVRGGEVQAGLKIVVVVLELCGGNR